MKGKKDDKKSKKVSNLKEIDPLDYIRQVIS
jgi:hypothetical protein